MHNQRSESTNKGRKMVRDVRWKQHSSLPPSVYYHPTREARQGRNENNTMLSMRTTAPFYACNWISWISWSIVCCCISFMVRSTSIRYLHTYSHKNCINFFLLKLGDHVADVCPREATGARRGVRGAFTSSTSHIVAQIDL